MQLKENVRKRVFPFNRASISDRQTGVSPWQGKNIWCDKGTPETKIKGRNILTVQHVPKIAGSVAEKSMAVWNTGAEMVAELYRKEKETEQHKAEAAANHTGKKRNGITGIIMKI